MNDFKHYLNRFQLYVMLVIVNFAYALGMIMTSYDVIDARVVISINI